MRLFKATSLVSAAPVNDLWSLLLHRAVFPPDSPLVKPNSMGAVPTIGAHEHIHTP